MIVCMVAGAGSEDAEQGSGGKCGQGTHGELSLNGMSLFIKLLSFA